MPSDNRRTGEGSDKANRHGLWLLELHIMFALVYPECERQLEAFILGKRLRCHVVYLCIASTGRYIIPMLLDIDVEKFPCIRKVGD